jgi:hypothetical protein
MPAREAAYCGFGPCSRQIWVSPRIGENHQSPHLSQADNIEASTTTPTSRHARLRQRGVWIGQWFMGIAVY